MNKSEENKQVNKSIRKIIKNIPGEYKQKKKGYIKKILERIQKTSIQQRVQKIKENDKLKNVETEVVTKSSKVKVANCNDDVDGADRVV